MGGGAWPFLVGGVICLVNSDNERDRSLLNSPANFLLAADFLEGQLVTNKWKFAVCDVHARYTEALNESTSTDRSGKPFEIAS